jgi:ATP-binding cassette, subfamily B, bacterial
MEPGGSFTTGDRAPRRAIGHRWLPTNATLVRQRSACRAEATAVTLATTTAALVWPRDRFGAAMIALARHSGLAMTPVVPARQPPSAPADLDRWLCAAGDQLGVTIEPVTALARDLDSTLTQLAPALVQVPDGILLVVGARGATLSCLGPDAVVRRIARRVVVRSIRASHELPHRPRIAKLLAAARLTGAAHARAEQRMLQEFLTTTTVMQGWLLRRQAGSSFTGQVRAAGLVRLGGVLLASHVGQYLLFLVSWWAIGRAILGGHLAAGWLAGWALLLVSSVPLVMLSTWSQGKLAVSLGALLRRRLLVGALELPHETINREGIGGLLGRTIEADQLERLVLGGGFQSALAAIELGLAVPVLALGAAGWLHAAVLVGWLALAAVLVVRLGRARQRWTDARLHVTGLTVERIVGHRTRLAQEAAARWHDGEDEALTSYLDRSAELDRRALAMLVLLPRGWLLVGLASLAPAFIAGADLVELGVGVGGVMLAWFSLARLVGGLDQLTTAYITWQRVAPLFHAAAGVFPAGTHRVRHRATPPEYANPAPPVGNEPLLEAIDVTYRHANRATDVLSGCDLVIRPGDRILIQGPSGGGKSTLVSLLTGTQMPRSGLLLARGLDISSLGETGWRARVASAPQFHENHVLTETFLFNLLMSRAWPPRPEDIVEAEQICEELGLSPLLARMPGGMYQMVGETGWQLSHGEQSRLFIARALLQRADVVILDESLAALDPENMAAALRCMRARAPSLVVIAHP